MITKKEKFKHPIFAPERIVPEIEDRAWNDLHCCADFKKKMHHKMIYGETEKEFEIIKQKSRRFLG